MQFDLSVLSDPPGALIDLDGEYTGRTTPAAFESLSGGTHTVRVRMDGAEPVEREILLERDDEVVVEVSGGASPGLLRTWEQNHYGGVYVDSFPEGAEIYVDGRKVNGSPRRHLRAEGGVAHHQGEERGGRVQFR